MEEILFENDRAIGVRARTIEEKTEEIRSRLVVDASGRATLIGKQLRLKQPLPGLEKVAISELLT